MSLIPLAAQLIKRAATDENYAMDLYVSIGTDRGALEGLVHGQVDEGELGWLSPSEWLWFVRWRQSSGGSLQSAILEYLGSMSVSRASRFHLRYLVMRDPATERAARALGETRPAESVGLRWLERDAHTSAESGEVARDALQVATEPAWFTLRVLTSLDDDRSADLRAQLRAFAERNGIASEVTSRWTSSGEL